MLSLFRITYCGITDLPLSNQTRFQVRIDRNLGKEGGDTLRPVDQAEASVRAESLPVQTHGLPQNIEAPGQEKEIE